MGRLRRPRLPRRLTGAALFGLLLLALTVLADQAGLFGRSDDDLSRYDGRTFTVVRCIDGDTLAIDARDGWSASTTVRLWGVDTPETVKPDTPVQHFGPEASAFAKQLTLNQPVRLELVPQRTRDKYKRLLAYVYLPDGRMLNLLLVETGHGYADPRFDHPYRMRFSQAMQQARRAGLGLWAEARPPDLPNYLHRQAVSAN